MATQSLLAKLKSLKGFFYEILIVIIGILIALAIDQFTEDLKHKKLVKQSLDNIKTEVERNKKRLLSHQSNFDSLFTIIDTLSKNTLLDIEDATINYRYIHLSSAAWETAQITQAIQYMKYEDVTNIATTYALQNQVLDMQKKNLDNLIPLLNTISTVPENTIVNYKKDLLTMLDFLEAQKNFTQALQEDYDEVLNKLKK